MNTHKGLTMIEMLIVITVIGVLSSMMMMSSTETVSTSNAMNIITTLRNFTVATMSLYNDSPDLRKDTETRDITSYVRPYTYKGTTNSGNDDDVYKNYCVKNFGGNLYAGYEFPYDDKALKGKVSKHTAENGLLGSDNISTTSTAPTDDYSNQDVVWMKVRSR